MIPVPSGRVSSLPIVASSVSRSDRSYCLSIHEYWPAKIAKTAILQAHRSMFTMLFVGSVVRKKYKRPRSEGQRPLSERKTKTEPSISIHYGSIYSGSLFVLRSLISSADLTAYCIPYACTKIANKSIIQAKQSSLSLKFVAFASLSRSRIDGTPADFFRMPDKEAPQKINLPWR